MYMKNSPLFTDVSFTSVVGFGPMVLEKEIKRESLRQIDDGQQAIKKA